MKIHFYSFIEKERTEFESEATIINDIVKFADPTNNGFISYSYSNNSMHFMRSGDAQMNIVFNLKKPTIATYKNNMGLEFSFLVKTKRLQITDNKITVEYDYYIDGTYQSNVKIWLLIENGLAKM